MAVWQFAVFVVPRDAERPKLVGDGWDVASLATGAWSRLEAKLRHELGAPNEMGDGMLMFGAENGDRVDLLTDDGYCELVARFDARIPSEPFAEFICDLARTEGCVLFAPESGSEVQPVTADLVLALAASRSASFCKDPRGFLKKVGDAG